MPPDENAMPKPAVLVGGLKVACEKQLRYYGTGLRKKQVLFFIFPKKLLAQCWQSMLFPK
jgi:hypothetical protein